MPQVTINVKTAKGAAVSGAIVSFRKAGENTFQIAGSTDQQGRRQISDLTSGNYVFKVELPGRDARPLSSPNKDVPPTTEHRFRVRMGPGCYYVVRRLRALIRQQEFEKAHRLIDSVKESYSDYAELPVLNQIPELEKSLPDTTERFA